jgi:hypothetical protein
MVGSSSKYGRVDICVQNFGRKTFEGKRSGVGGGRSAWTVFSCLRTGPVLAALVNSHQPPGSAKRQGIS